MWGIQSTLVPMRGKPSYGAIACAAAVSCLAVLCCGCGARQTVKLVPPFPLWEDRYRVRDLVPPSALKVDRLPDSDPPVKFSARAVPLWVLVEDLARQSGRTIVVEQTLISREVTVQLSGQSLRVALQTVARLLGVEVIERDGLYVLGTSKPMDRQVLVRRVRSLSAEEAQQAIQSVSGGGATATVYKDGLLIVSGMPDGIERVAGLLDQLDSRTRNQWAIQLHLVTMTARDLQDFGLDTTPALDLAVSQSAASAANIGQTRLNASLRTVLRAAQDRSSVSITAQPVFLMLDGEKAEFNRGTRIPIRNFTTSANGNSQQSSITYVDVGTRVGLAINEVAADAVRLNVELELSDLVEVTSEGLPRTDRRSFSSPCVVKSGGTYLLTSVEIGTKRKARGTWLHGGKLADESQEILQVWARAVAVDGEGLVHALESEKGT